MIEVFVDVKTNAVYMKTAHGDYHQMMLQGAPSEVNEDDLVRTGQFSMDHTEDGGVVNANAVVM